MKTERMTRWISDQLVSLAFVAVVIAITAVIVLHIEAQTRASVGAVQAVVGAPRTEQQIADDIIKDLVEWTELIGDRPPGWNQLQRRESCGAMLCIIATEGNRDPNFRRQWEAACAALAFHFPHRQCQACEN